MVRFQWTHVWMYYIIKHSHQIIYKYSTLYLQLSYFIYEFDKYEIYIYAEHCHVRNMLKFFGNNLLLDYKLVDNETRYCI